MQVSIRLFITALTFCMSLPATAAEKYALLIAVAKYEYADMNKPAPLEFPEDDAKAIGQLLEAGGYTVDLLLGQAATKAAINSKLQTLQSKADADGVVLVGLFGHGIEVDTVDSHGDLIKDGCFCPYDTSIREALDFKGRPVLDSRGNPQVEPDPDTLIRLGDLMRTLKLAKAGNRIVLADCCRTTPNAARGRSSFGANFSVQDLPDNTSLLFGCSPNEQAFEHKDWGHGAFTKCLLETIGELSAAGPVDTAQLASQMKKRVPALVASVSPRDRQTPKPFITDVVDLQLENHPDNRPQKLTNSIGQELVLIPAGTFLMGSPASEKDRSEDETQHQVTLSTGFYMGRTEVTQGQWRAVMGTEPWKGYAEADDQNAASYIRWDEATEFCNQLSQKEGKTYRLPTEAEWEYACRAGTTTRFYFGDDESLLGEYEWFIGNAWDKDEKYAHRVGQKKPNPVGLYDMHGNQNEWCSDQYAFFNNDGPLNDRVLRGGSWASSEQLCRSAYRYKFSRADREDTSDYAWRGFRVALSHDPIAE
ncbi:MAG: SUMF1/EgtB/PvdO family nonheme iron enzyme [Planctomycetota bacterium]